MSAEHAMIAADASIMRTERKLELDIRLTREEIQDFADWCMTLSAEDYERVKLIHQVAERALLPGPRWR